MNNFDRKNRFEIKKKTNMQVDNETVLSATEYNFRLGQHLKYSRYIFQNVAT